MKAIINVKCPECGGFLEIDVARQRVLSHKMDADVEASPEEKAELFDEVVSRVKNRHDKSDAIFMRPRRTSPTTRTSWTTSSAR